MLVFRNCDDGVADDVAWLRPWASSDLRDNRAEPWDCGVEDLASPCKNAEPEATGDSIVSGKSRQYLYQDRATPDL
jgi:hypothetical protein